MRRETRSLVPCRSVSLAVLLVLVSLVAAPSRSHASVATTEADDAPVDSLTAVTDQATLKIDPRTPAKVTGRVVDLESGRALDYTNVVFSSVSGPEGKNETVHSGTITLREGIFYHSLPPGFYTATFLYLGYEKITTGVFEIRPGEPHRIDVALKVKPIVMKSLTVQGQAIKNTEVAALSRQKKALVVQESITAEQISRSTDSDAAEALERVTGLSVVGGKYVFVRGLGDRYSSTSLNGASLSSPEPSRRTVPLDIFPSAMLDNIVVQKTFTPDMGGEFGGGNIDVQTKVAVRERKFSQKLSFGYSGNVLDNDYYSYRGSDLDFLGMDDGTRGLPDALAPYSRTRLPGKKNFLGDGLEPSALGDIRESFTNVWTPRKQSSTPMNYSYSGLYADGFELFGRPSSFLAAASLSNSYNTKQYEQIDIRGGSEGNFNARTEFDKVSSTHSALLGLTGAINVQPTDGSKLSYNILHTRGADDQAQIAEGTNDQGERIRQTILDYVERELTSHVVQGKHLMFGANTEIGWIASSSEAYRDQPDSRFSEYQWKTLDYITDPDDPEEILDTVEGWGKSPLGFPFQRTFGSSRENDTGLKLDVEQAMPGTSWLENRLKTGWSYRERDRTTAYRIFGIRCQGCEFDGTGSGEATFSPELYDDPEDLETMIISETTRPLDNYDSMQKTIGAFSMLSMNFSDRLQVVGGARYETSEQSVTAGGNLGDEETVDSQLSNEDWLPALNTTYRLTDRVNLRSSYSRTVNRPEMRELAPLRIFNYETGVEEQGNRFVEQATIDSYDLRVEAYPGRRRYLAFSLFRKDLDRPIERILVPQAAGNFKEVPGNGDQGTLEGWEVEWRGGIEDAAQNVGQVTVAAAWLATRPFWALGQVPGLGFMDGLSTPWKKVPAVRTGLLRNFGLTFNFSRIESEVDINISRIEDEAQFTVDPEANIGDDTSADVLENAPLTGQSTFAFNAGLIYGDGSRDASLMIKDFGDRLEAFGVGSPDLYESVPPVLDFGISQKFDNGIKIKLSVENILDERREVYYDAQPGQTFESIDGTPIDDPVRTSTLDGRKFGVSVSFAR